MHFKLFAHVVIVKFDLTNEVFMFSAAIQWLETLQDTVNNERVVFVTNSDKVTMALHVYREAIGAVRFSNIDADRVPSYTLDDFLQRQVFE